MKFRILLFFLWSCQLLLAQRGIVRSLFMEEKQVISASRNAGNESRVIAKGLTIHPHLLEEHQSLLKKFWSNNKDKFKDIAKDWGEEYLGQKLEDGANVVQYLYQIYHNPHYPSLYRAICKKIKVDTIHSADVVLLLIGQKVNNFSIKPDKLYRIYFLLSDHFARNELQQMASNSLCGSKDLQFIKKLAVQRKVDVDLSSCQEEQSEDDDGVFWGLLILAGIGYMIYKLIRLIIRKIIGKENQNTSGS